MNEKNRTHLLSPCAATALLNELRVHNCLPRSSAATKQRTVRGCRLGVLHSGRATTTRRHANPATPPGDHVTATIGLRTERSELLAGVRRLPSGAPNIDPRAIDRGHSVLRGRRRRSSGTRSRIGCAITGEWQRRRLAATHLNRHRRTGDVISGVHIKIGRASCWERV